MSQTFFGLNLDVLLCICAYLDNRDFRQLIPTCRAVSEFATPHLIASVTLSRDQEQVADFCKFMLAKGRARPPLLRYLTIARSATWARVQLDEGNYNFVPDFCFASSLADVLEQATNIQRISIGRLENLLDIEPRVAVALTERCPCLEHVDFDRVGRHATRMLRKMKTLRRMMVNLVESPVSSLLAPCTNALAALSFSISDPNAIDQDVSFDRVYELSLKGDLPLKCKLVRIFPNLRRLRLERPWIGHALEAIKAQNRLCRATWENGLEVLEGKAKDLAALSLRTRVWRVDLLDDFFKKGRCSVTSDPDAFIDVLRATSPSVLSFSIADPISNIPPSWYTRLGEEAANLNFLEVRLGTLDDPALLRLLQVLKYSQITYLCIIALEGPSAVFQHVHLPVISEALRTVQYVEYLGEERVRSWWQLGMADSGARSYSRLSNEAGWILRRRWLDAS